MFLNLLCLDDHPGEGELKEIICKCQQIFLYFLAIEFSAFTSNFGQMIESGPA